MTAFGLSACGLLVGAAAANATAATAAGTASLGSASVVIDGTNTTIDALAPCDLAHPGEFSTEGVTRDGVADFGKGSTSCATDTAHKKNTMSANGADFRLTALRAYGGPEIGFSSYQAGCAGATSQSSAQFSMGGYYGIQLPEKVPANYSVTVPGNGQGAKPLAKLTFGEVVPAPQQDGSITMNALHVQLFPDGGPASGDIYVGSVHCTLA